MAQWAFVIMPTHCVNDTDSLQQLPPLPQTRQPIPPSQPLVGRNPLKEICRGGSASLFQPEHVLGILQSFLTLTKDSTLLWKKYFMSQMSHKFRSQTYSWINDTQTERKTVWRAESSCSAVELNSYLQQKGICLKGSISCEVIPEYSILKDCSLSEGPTQANSSALEKLYKAEIIR